jgi:hypothetical protein
MMVEDDWRWLIMQWFVTQNPTKVVVGKGQWSRQVDVGTERSLLWMEQ